MQLFPQLVKRKEQRWKFGDVGSDFLELLTEQVEVQAARSAGSDPRFTKSKPRDQADARGLIPDTLKHTFETVAEELLFAKADILNEASEKKIRRKVETRLINAKRLPKNPWYLPFGGQLAKMIIRVVVALALGYLRTQFPLLAIADTGKVALALRQVVDREPIT